MKLTKEAYEGLRTLIYVIFPGLSVTLFFGSYIFDLTNTKLILGMVAVVSLAIGLVLNNQDRTHDGKIVLTDTEDKMVFTLQLEGDPEALVHKDSVSFKIQKGEPVAEFEL